MIDESRALVQRYFAAFNSGRAEGMLDCLSDAVAHDVNQGERREGKARLMAICW